MINVFIADNDINYIRELMHIINSYFDNVRVSDISINDNEALKILNNSNDIDIILLEFSSSSINTFNILNNLSQANRYANSFIVFSDNISTIDSAKYLNSNIIYKIIPKTLNYNIIVENLKEIIIKKSLNYNIKEIRNKIIKELVSIGYAFSHSGTQYLIDAIEISYYCNNNLTKNLNKYIYPLISKKHNQTNNNIKTSINRATETMYYNCEESVLKQYFGFNTIKKPNIKTVINTIKIKLLKK